MNPPSTRIQWPLFVIIAAGFLWVKKFGFHYTASGDENAYFYMAKLMTEGKYFYRDFFFAHPPLQLILLAGVYALGGFNFTLLKLTAVLPVLVGSGFIYHQLWRLRGGLTAGFFLIIFLFNYELLKISTHPFGLNLTSLFLMLSLYYFLEENGFFSGFFWGWAAITGLYALPWGVIPAGYYLLGKGRRRMLVRFIGGFLIIFGTVNLLFLLRFGQKYFTPVFLYHFLKPRGKELVADIFIRVMRRNLLLFFLPFLCLWVPGWRRRNVVLVGGIIFLVVLASLNPLFTQYFMLPLPFLAWVGADSLSSWIKSQRPPRLFLAGVALSGAVLAGFSFDNVRRYIIHERETTFKTVSACRDFIIQNSRPDDLLFGHVTTVPLLALVSVRGIALDLVDTNHMRFKSGLISLEETLAKLKEEARLKFFIIQESPFWLDQRIQSFLEGCSPVAIFEETRERIIIYDCRIEQ